MDLSRPEAPPLVPPRRSAVKFISSLRTLSVRRSEPTCERNPVPRTHSAMPGAIYMEELLIMHYHRSYPHPGFPRPTVRVGPCQSIFIHMPFWQNPTKMLHRFLPILHRFSPKCPDFYPKCPNFYPKCTVFHLESLPCPGFSRCTPSTYTHWQIFHPAYRGRYLPPTAYRLYFPRKREPLDIPACECE